MTIYLPVAEITVNVFLIFGIGTAVGFISGMFGVGGGFLLTPLLIFSGIPPAVVVASEASQIAATAFSGAISYGRKKLIDVKLGIVLISGGVAGSVSGVLVFTLLKRIGQLDLFIAISYVVLLGTIGTLMLRESVGAIRRRGAGQGAPALRQAGEHRWIHGLPLKLRFHRAKLYMSAIPVVALGFGIGFIGAILGVGGGFILVPALIYLLRVPTMLAVGVSLFQTVVTMSVASVMHATTNYSVDIVLSLVLMLGGVIGAQYGASVGQKLKAEELRALLAFLILAVALRFAFELVATPAAPFSVGIPGMSAARLAAAGLAWLALVAPARAERLILGLSTDVIPITSNFAGTTLALFGVIEAEPGAGPRQGGYEAVVVVRGPPQTQVVRRRERVLVIWVNGTSRTYLSAPVYYAALSSRPLPEIASEPVRRQHQLGLDGLQLLQLWDWRNPGQDALFREAFLSTRRDDGLYAEEAGDDHLRFLAANVFRARIPLPSNVPTGLYAAEVRVFSNGALVGEGRTAFTIEKTGLEATVYAASREQPLLYGALTVALAISTGWIAGILFRRS